MIVRLAGGLGIVFLIASCDAPRRDSEAAAPPEVEVLAVEAPAPLPAPVVIEQAEPEPPSFDPVTATAATARVVAVHGERSWLPCGRFHSTGAFEVEVLEVGEPAPRMLLIISCPVDFANRHLLRADEILAVTLYARPQPWPMPAVARKLPPELPRRYIKSVLATASLPPESIQKIDGVRKDRKDPD